MLGLARETIPASGAHGFIISCTAQSVSGQLVNGSKKHINDCTLIHSRAFYAFQLFLVQFSLKVDDYILCAAAKYELSMDWLQPTLWIGLIGVCVSVTFPLWHISLLMLKIIMSNQCRAIKISVRRGRCRKNRQIQLSSCVHFWARLFVHLYWGNRRRAAGWAHTTSAVRYSQLTYDDISEHSILFW